MTEQEMIKRYQGICQFQAISINCDKVEQLLEAVIPLMNIPFDFNEYYQKKMDAKKDENLCVYYVQDSKDPRCLIMVEFQEPYAHNQSAHVIIRCHDQLSDSIEEVFKKLKARYFPNCLVQNSKMNEIVKRHSLDLDIVDEFDLQRTLFNRREFWGDYFFVFKGRRNRIYPELVEPIIFSVKNSFSFILEIDSQFVSPQIYFTHFSFPQKVQLGYDDGCHPFPYVFRWDELETICNFLSIQYPENPAIPFLLLYRFALVTIKDDRETIEKKIAAAWRSLQLFSESEINQLKREYGFRKDVYWKWNSEFGWHCTGNEYGIYSFRVKENKEFPSAEIENLIKSLNHRSTKFNHLDQFLNVWYETETIQSDQKSNFLSDEDEFININDNDLPF